MFLVKLPEVRQVRCSGPGQVGLVMWHYLAGYGIDERYDYYVVSSADVYGQA